ncbi:HNH endonuclease signature motif containing protein [Nocardiopsis kunsanensis]|uniref:HNH nuclease domain-containing protein n=1 Tax=Nocardiopsis kunsanensis TaxID=141693 RepID=A0A918XIX7_9ACTN|nr:HNH endonuclease signature motif containing protein [Nocardiopsis kunsanensis]GHD33839.1 hypothetical protein GCM10007147_38980 [Nocardiopsis kunsanensis]
MTNHTADTSTGTDPDAAVAALGAAARNVISSFDGDLPPGTAANTLERLTAVHRQVDALKLAMLAPIARMEASGQLLEESGQKSVKAYMMHTWGLHPGEAERLALLATGLHTETLPHTAQALAEGVLTVGEAAALASGAEREVKKRDTNTHPDAEQYRSMIETGLVGAKRERTTMSVQSLTRAANALGLELNPDRPEKNEEQAFTARGAQMRRAFEGTFHFQAWGPASDAEKLRAALESYTAPYDGHAPVPEHARTYDALVAAAGFAHGHHGCRNSPGPKALITVTVPLSTLVGVEGGAPATTQDGNVLATSVVRAMAPQAQLRRLVFDDRTGLPLDLGRAHRLAPGYLRTLAFAKHSTCAWQGGCDVPVSQCEADHITEFSHGGTTSAENLQPLCSTHNRLKYRRATHRHTGTRTGSGGKSPPEKTAPPDGTPGGGRTRHP